jgi:hypothetical protein
MKRCRLTLSFKSARSDTDFLGAEESTGTRPLDREKHQYWSGERKRVSKDGIEPTGKRTISILGGVWG